MKIKGGKAKGNKQGKGLYKVGCDRCRQIIMAGKYTHAGAAREETGALIGMDGSDSHLITISQQFTCLHLWQLGGGECVSRVEIICLHVSLRAFIVSMYSPISSQFFFISVVLGVWSPLLNIQFRIQRMCNFLFHLPFYFVDQLPKQSTERHSSKKNTSTCYFRTFSKSALLSSTDIANSAIVFMSNSQWEKRGCKCILWGLYIVEQNNSPGEQKCQQTMLDYVGPVFYKQPTLVSFQSY